MTNQSKGFVLSPKNLIGIPLDKYEQDFTFIVNGEKYHTSRIIADILSPIIREMHLVDSTINEFCISVTNNSSFSEFLKLVNFSQKPLDSDQMTQFSEYFNKLGNNNEYIRLQISALKPITTDNVLDQFSRLIKITEYQKSNNFENYEEENLEQMISFISSHFYELDQEEIQRLPTSIIAEILDHKELKVESEDSLLNFIIELYQKDEKNSDLFEKVYFNNVSENVLEKFIDIFSIADLNQSIWKSICVRLFPIKNPKSTKISRYIRINNEYKEFKYEPGHEFEGIMRYLSEQTHGNINDNGTIKITSNSIRKDYEHPKNLVDYHENNYYYSDSYKDNYILFDFKDRLIQLTSYSIKSLHYSSNGSQLRNWVIEVSNNENDWIEIDSHTDDSTLNGASISANFKINKENNEFYRFIRLRQTGYSWYNYPNSCSYNMSCTFIEFFGKLRE